jgi:hypothetical protein
VPGQRKGGIWLRLHALANRPDDHGVDADLVRQGPGNEKDRLTLLRQHQQHVTSRIGQLTECLDLISYKVKVYEDHVAQGTASQLWSASSVAENE